MSIAVEIADGGSLARVDERFEKLSSFDVQALLEGIGAEVESQTRRRISDEKRAPDGQEWPDWSDLYAETRHANQSLLRSEGHLLESIQYELSNGEVLVGSNLVYAATHQFGDEKRGIPQREFLGLSIENEIDLVRLTVDFLDEVLK